MKNAADILQKLKSLSNPQAVEGMARYGINPHNIYGVSLPTLRALAKEIGQDHSLAQELWASGIHEARMLASIIDVPEEVSEQQMEAWADDFDSWDVCDQCCNNLFVRTRFASLKAVEWSKRSKEFVRRAGFVLMAQHAVHDKRAGDEIFLNFLSLINDGATDERNYVKKAVNWALRQIGKRNLALNQEAIKTALQIQKIDSKIARWITSDALRELTSEAVQKKWRGSA